MNKNTAKDYLPLVQALADGKVIQFNASCSGWTDTDWIVPDQPAYRYRIKPEPSEKWFNRYSDGSEYGPFDTKIEAIDDGDASQSPVQVRYREVIE